MANTKNIAPIIAVPTTAGTGSEVGRASVISDSKHQAKKIIFHPKMLPGLVILDPKLTLGLPPNLTAWTGIDALVHALEAFCAPGYHPMADGIAIQAIKMITEQLPIAVENGMNLEARGLMLTASTMAAVSFQKGLGSIHSVSHQLGAIYNLPHGLANSILLPYGLRQNADAIEDKMIQLAKILELEEPGSDAVINHILDFRQKLGIPNSLMEVDVNTERAEEIGKKAFDDPSTLTNAKPIKAQDLQNLFSAAVEGTFENL